jgi:hypothetical protein
MTKINLFLILVITIIELYSKIHIIGDSHSHSFINLGYLEHYWATEYKNKLILVPYKIHWLGPVTMHRIGRDGLSYFNVKNLDVQENDDVITVFGEIDVRCHIGRIADLKNLDLDFLINKLSHDYIQTIIRNREQFNKINFIVFNVLPPTKFYSNQYFPYYGTLENRIFITNKLNAKLKELCQKFNFQFIDIYDLYTDNEGKLNLLLGNDDPHLNPYHTNQIKQCALKCVDLEKYNIEFTEKLIAYEKDYVKKN